MTEPQAEIPYDSRQALSNTTGRMQAEFRQTLAGMGNQFSDTMARQKRTYDASLTIPEVREAFTILVEAQAGPEIVGKYSPFRRFDYDRTAEKYYDKTREEYMAAFVESGLWQDMMQQTSTAIAKLISQGESFPAGEFAGMVFKYLAYGIVAADEAKKGHLVLSPQATDDFYGEFIAPHPESESKDWVFDTEFLHDEHSYVPDGLVIDPKTKKIVGIVEYKMSRHGVSRQIDRSAGFIERLYDRGLLVRGMDSPPAFIFVAPRDTKLQVRFRDRVDFRPLVGEGMRSDLFGRDVIDPLLEEIEPRIPIMRSSGVERLRERQRMQEPERE